VRQWIQLPGASIRLSARRSLEQAPASEPTLVESEIERMEAGENDPGDMKADVSYVRGGGIRPQHLLPDSAEMVDEQLELLCRR
jgi:hypothetical protein